MREERPVRHSDYIKQICCIDDRLDALEEMVDIGDPDTFTEGAILFGDSDGTITEDPTNLSWISGVFTINGKLTVTGGIDPTWMQFSGPQVDATVPNESIFITDGSASGAAAGNLVYKDSGGAYADLEGGGGGNGIYGGSGSLSAPTVVTLAGNALTFADGGFGISMTPGADILQIHSDSQVVMGDVDASGNSTTINIQDGTSSIVLSGNTSLSTGVSVNAILDEDTLATDSDTALATQQSIKAYVDTAISGIPAGLTGTGVANKVAYWSGASTLTQTNLFHFDGTNLGIGIATPAYKIHVSGTGNEAINVVGSSSSGIDLSSVSALWANAAASEIRLGVAASGSTNVRVTALANDISIHDPTGTPGGIATFLKTSRDVKFDHYTTGTHTGTIDALTSFTSDGTVIRSSAASVNTFLGTLSGTGVANKVAYWSGASTLTQTSLFHFDGTNLGVGTASPAYKIHVSGTGNQAINVVGTSSSSIVLSNISALWANSGGTEIRLGTAASGSTNIRVTALANDISMHDPTGTPGNVATFLKTSRNVKFDHYTTGTHTGTIDAMTSFTSDGTVIRSDAATSRTFLETTSGSFTPTLTVDSGSFTSTTAREAHWQRIGSIVSVTGSFAGDGTPSPTKVSIRLTLPIASNFGSIYDCSGLVLPVEDSSPTANMGSVIGDTTNDEAFLSFVADSDLIEYKYSYKYKII